MPRCPLVRPDVVRLPLSDGDFLDVKKRLNTGEWRAMVTSQYNASHDHVTLNLDQMGLSKVLAYVVGWSFVDFDQKPLAFNEQTIRGMDPDVFREVLDAVERHEEAQDTSRSAEKNVTAGPLVSAAT